LDKQFQSGAQNKKHLQNKKDSFYKDINKKNKFFFIKTQVQNHHPTKETSYFFKVINKYRI